MTRWIREAARIFEEKRSRGPATFCKYTLTLLDCRHAEPKNTMPRPSRLEEQRRELLPILATAFAELGFRRTTTAQLAQRCGVRENILYRHWRDKVAMFAAALDHIGDLAIDTWRRAADAPGPGTSAERILGYEADHLGEFGNYRLIFSALGDTDAPVIRSTVKRIYRRFHRVLRDELIAARGDARCEPDADLTTWAIIGLGTVATIGQELGLMSKAARRRLIQRVGRVLLLGSRPA